MSNTTTGKRRRWFQFSLRTIFAVVTIMAIASCVIPPSVAWLFPPKREPGFNELKRLIERTIQEPTPNQDEPNLTLIFGEGQEVHEQQKE